MTADPRLIAFARQLRCEPTPPETVAWRLLRGRRLAGFRFRRQHPIPPYITDFYCAVAGMVIELDGDSHAGQEENDRVRQAFLESRGLRVLRFGNAAMMEDHDAFTVAVYHECVTRTAANPAFRNRLSEWGQFVPKTSEIAAEGFVDGPG